MPRVTAIVGCCGNSAASALGRIPHIFSLGDLSLHDRVQILQPSRAAERLTAHIAIVGYRIVPELNCIGEGV